MAQFTNQARLSYNGIVVDSNVTVGEFAECLAAEKHAVADAYSVGDEITFVVSIVNSGAGEQTDLTLTDDLGSGVFGGSAEYPLVYIPGSATYYRNGVLMPQPNVAGSAPLTITGITAPPSGNAIVIYKSYVTEFADPNAGGSLTNTVTVNGAFLSSPIRASETLTARTGSNLSIRKSLDPTVISGRGSALTYTVTVENFGNTEAGAADNVIITDTFSPILHGLSVFLNGSALPPQSYSYSESTGNFSTRGGAITVPAASFVRLANGAWTAVPGSATLVLTGTV